MIAVNNIKNDNQQTREEKAEETMRILANLLIDRFLEDKRNNRLKSILKSSNISLD